MRVRSRRARAAVSRRPGRRRRDLPSRGREPSADARGLRVRERRLHRGVVRPAGSLGRPRRSSLPPRPRRRSTTPTASASVTPKKACARFSDATGARVTVFRWTNLFGKWCRPNYNSVTATFCHNVAHDLPIAISDPSREIELAYIDDVVAAVAGGTRWRRRDQRYRFAQVTPTYRVTLGELAAAIQSFRQIAVQLRLPDFADPVLPAAFTRPTSRYLPPDDFAYPLDIKSRQPRRVGRVHQVAAQSARFSFRGPSPASPAGTIITTRRPRSFWCSRATQ